MATTKEIKRRIGSIKNTKKITKAMELVAASKMKKAVDSTLASRDYARYAWQILKSLKENQEKNGGETHPILKEREVKNVLIVLVTSNRGLCGAYNTQVIKKVLESIKIHNGKHKQKFIAIGKKGESALRRMDKEVVASFIDLPEHLTLRDTNPVAETIINEYKEGRVDKVLVAYTDFESALTQTPHMRQLLPVTIEELEKTLTTIGPEKGDGKEGEENGETEYLFEPDYTKLMKVMVWKLAQMQVYQMLVESLASEHSARMMAMKNASESAGEMIDDLTLVFNKARQAGITQEISEISGGMAALSK